MECVRGVLTLCQPFVYGLQHLMNPGRISVFAVHLRHGNGNSQLPGESGLLTGLVHGLIKKSGRRCHAIGPR